MASGSRPDVRDVGHLQLLARRGRVRDRATSTTSSTPASDPDRARRGDPSVLIFAPALGLLLDRIMLRRLSTAPVYARIVGTIGLLVALPQLALWLVETVGDDVFRRQPAQARRHRRAAASRQASGPFPPTRVPVRLARAVNGPPRQRPAGRLRGRRDRRGRALVHRAAHPGRARDARRRRPGQPRRRCGESTRRRTSATGLGPDDGARRASAAS